MCAQASSVRREVLLAKQALGTNSVLGGMEELWERPNERAKN